MNVTGRKRGAKQSSCGGKQGIIAARLGGYAQLRIIFAAIRQSAGQEFDSISVSDVNRQ
jgi:hypothetical protein